MITNDPIMNALVGNSGMGERKDQKTTKPTTRKGKTITPLIGQGITTPTTQPAVTLSERKTAEEIRKLEIDNAVKLNHLVPVTMLKGAIGQVGQEIKMQFVDLPRRESETFAARLGIPGKSRDLEREWSEYNRKGIENVLAAVEKLQRDEIYE